MTKPLITLSDPRSNAAEAYRSLYINLSFSSQEQPLRTLLVTSAAAGEGKSATLANLAVVAAQMGQRVMLVDCDLRNPQQHELFGLRNDSGLTTLVSGKEAATAALHGVNDAPGLSVLTSGPLPVSPSQVLAARRLDEILAELAEQADLVLLDAPPAAAVADASVLATKADGVLLVLNAGQTKRDSARRAKEALEKVNAHIVGVVLNNVTDGAGL
jgi:non-specific protein-tyrosine kinase